MIFSFLNIATFLVLIGLYTVLFWGDYALKTENPRWGSYFSPNSFNWYKVACMLLGITLSAFFIINNPFWYYITLLFIVALLSKLLFVVFGKTVQPISFISLIGGLILFLVSFII